MKRKLSGYGPLYNHIFILLVVLIPLLDSLTGQSPRLKFFIVCFLIAIFSLVLYNLCRLRIVSFNEDFVYVRNFRSAIQLHYLQIKAIKKSLGSFTVNESRLYHAYKMEYIDDYGDSRNAKFYVTEFVAFAAFQQKLFSKNPGVEFRPHGARSVER